MRETVNCPYCKSDKVAEIFYGMPLFSEKMQQDIENGKLVLGDCWPKPENRVCLNCKKKWKSEIAPLNEDSI
jgi:hypothetical protein